MEANKKNPNLNISTGFLFLLRDHLNLLKKLAKKIKKIFQFGCNPINKRTVHKMPMLSCLIGGSEKYTKKKHLRS